MKAEIKKIENMEAFDENYKKYIKNKDFQDKKKF